MLAHSLCPLVLTPKVHLSDQVCILVSLRHFIYRFCIYFAPHSTKDWAKGHKFIEWVLASDELQPGERWVLEGLMAIRGSRNGVFWADAIAVII